MNALEKFCTPSYKYFPKPGGLGYSGPQTWVRILIVQALERLGIPLADWPPFGKDFAKNGFLLPGGRIVIHGGRALSASAIRYVARLYSDWQARAEALWKEHRSSFLEFCKKRRDEDLEAGRIIELKRYRSTGKKRIIAPLETRFEWAALRISGRTFPEISDRYSSAGVTFSPKQIEMSCRDLFKGAGLKPTGDE